MKILYLLMVGILMFIPTILCSCKISKRLTINSEVKKYRIEVLRNFEHKGDAKFTQGLAFYEGYLFEGTGLYGKTELKKIDIKDGNIILHQNMSQYFDKFSNNLFFGEGITIFNNKIIQLTWKEKKAFLYDMEFNKLNKEFSYDTEGWGLTHNKNSLIMSDGSSKIYFRNPENFEVERLLDLKGYYNINELEYVDGIIYANIWKTDHIIMIDETTGDVVGVVDLSNELETKIKETNQDYVLNGIAYNPQKQIFYITGKNWAKIYEVKFIEKQGP